MSKYLLFSLLSASLIASPLLARGNNTNRESRTDNDYELYERNENRQDFDPYNFPNSIAEESKLNLPPNSQENFQQNSSIYYDESDPHNFAPSDSFSPYYKEELPSQDLQNNSSTYQPSYQPTNQPNYRSEYQTNPPNSHRYYQSQPSQYDQKSGQQTYQQTTPY